MSNIITLIDAICDVYDRNDFRPNADGSTHCNQAVHAVASALGYEGFEGLTADGIMGIMSSSSDWIPVHFEDAQNWANTGALLIAGMAAYELKVTEPGTKHGHVVVIRPGLEIESGKWGQTPRCVNIGKNDFLARAQTGPLTMMPVGVNDAFIPKPRIWAWKASVSPDLL